MTRSQRFDVGAVRGVQPTPQGGIRVDAAIARTGILEYSDGKKTWREYRPDSEVFSNESLATLKGAPVTDGHPPTLVHSANYTELSRGHAEDLRRDGDKVAATLVVQDANTANRVKDGSLKEVSIGYTAEIDWTPGVTPDGQRYDAVQRAIHGNHVALGPPGWGRSGPEVAIRMDGAAVEVSTGRSDGTAGQPAVPSVRPANRSTMSTIKVKGTTYKMDAPEEAAAAQAAVDDSEKSEKSAKDDVASLNKQLIAMVQQVAQIAAKLEVAEAKEGASPQEPPPEVLDSLIATREQLRADAQKVLGREVKLDGKPAREIHELTIKKIAPQIKLDGMSSENISAMFNGVIAARSMRSDGLEHAHAIISAAHNDAADDDYDPFLRQQERIGKGLQTVGRAK